MKLPTSLSFFSIVLIFFSFLSFCLGESCIPKSGSQDAIQECFDEQCHQDNGVILLQSGLHYSINKTSIQCVIQNTVSISTTDTAPARLTLMDLHFNGLFRANGSTAELNINNVDIQGISGRYEGVFFNGEGEGKVNITYCQIMTLEIRQYWSHFIKNADEINISNTNFYNNIVWSIVDTSVSYPSYMIGIEDDFSKNTGWKVALSNCEFVNNTVSSTKDAFTLFFYFSGSANCDSSCNYGESEKQTLLLDFGNLKFESNQVKGLGSAFLWIETSYMANSQNGPPYPIIIKRSNFTKNTVASAHTFECGLEFGEFCPSFFIFTTRYTWSPVTSSYLMEGNSLYKNSVTNGGQFFSFQSIGGSIDIIASSFDNNNLSRAEMINYIRCSGSLSITNSSFLNNNIVTKEYLSHGYLVQFLQVTGHVSLSDLLFQNNFVKTTSGISFLGSGAITSISNSYFIDNAITNNASVLMFDGTSSSTLFGNTSFENNTISEVSTVISFLKPLKSVTINDSSFQNNIINNMSSIVFIYGASDTINIENSWFEKIELNEVANLIRYVDGALSSSMIIEISDFSVVKSNSVSANGYPLFFSNNSDITFTNCSFSSIESEVAPIYFRENIGLGSVTMNNCDFNDISANKNQTIISLDNQGMFSIINASFGSNIETPYDISVNGDSNIAECTWNHFAANQDITIYPTDLENSCTQNSYYFPSLPCKSFKCWLQKNTQNIIIVALLVILVLLVLYINRTRIQKVYDRYKIYLNNRRKANMREHQLKGLILAFGGTGAGEIKSILTATLPHIIIPFADLKLDGGEIARGGSGIVMKGTLLRPQRATIAIKVIQSQMAGEMDEIQEELSMLYSLNHPNIVSFIGVTFYEETIMILQDFCPKNLKQYIDENGHFKRMNSFLDMTLTILDTLSFLHNEKNIAHRDLKPENILLDEKNEPKICDLGMAKFVGKGNHTIHRGADGGLGGTPGYMPPEVILIEGGQRYEPKFWDVFSMSMMMYFMWTGKEGLNDIFESPFLIMEEISKGTRPLLPSYIPIPIKDIIRNMWHQEFIKRPTINEVATQMSKLYEIEQSDSERNTRISSNSIQLSNMKESLL